MFPLPSPGETPTTQTAELRRRGRRLVAITGLLVGVAIAGNVSAQTQSPVQMQSPAQAQSPVPEAATPTGPADGTWRQDGRYIVLNMNGQEFRLLHTGETPAAPIQPELVGGLVRGRLANRGKPLARFDVALMPLKKTWLGFTIDRSVEASKLIAITDESGAYRFVNVPVGLYKLKWRAPGESGWIRRVELRPDVRVRMGEETEAKEIRVALRTIN